MTFLTALRHDRIDAPWVVDGPINGELFRLFVEKVLAPTLNPDDVVVLDDLASHKSHAVRNAIRAAGARLFFLSSTPFAGHPFASAAHFYNWRVKSRRVSSKVELSLG
jgi:transposase